MDPIVLAMERFGFWHRLNNWIACLEASVYYQTPRGTLLMEQIQALINNFHNCYSRELTYCLALVAARRIVGTCYCTDRVCPSVVGCATFETLTWLPEVPFFKESDKLLLSRFGTTNLAVIRQRLK